VTEAQQYQVSLDEARELAKWHVHVLRTALGADPQAPCQLINVRGQGYRLIVD
jgi:DNA-binding response OmpR family regulator